MPSLDGRGMARDRLADDKRRGACPPEIHAAAPWSAALLVQTGTRSVDGRACKRTHGNDTNKHVALLGITRPQHRRAPRTVIHARPSPPRPHRPDTRTSVLAALPPLSGLRQQAHTGDEQAPSTPVHTCKYDCGRIQGDIHFRQPDNRREKRIWETESRAAPQTGRRRKIATGNIDKSCENSPDFLGAYRLAAEVGSGPKNFEDPGGKPFRGGNRRRERESRRMIHRERRRHQNPLPSAGMHAVASNSESVHSVCKRIPVASSIKTKGSNQRIKQRAGASGGEENQNRIRKSDLLLFLLPSSTLGHARALVSQRKLSSQRIVDIRWSLNGTLLQDTPQNRLPACRHSLHVRIDKAGACIPYSHASPRTPSAAAFAPPVAIAGCLPSIPAATMKKSHLKPDNHSMANPALRLILAVQSGLELAYASRSTLAPTCGAKTRGDPGRDGSTGTQAGGSSTPSMDTSLQHAALDAHTHPALPSRLGAGEIIGNHVLRCVHENHSPLMICSTALRSSSGIPKPARVVPHTGAFVPSPAPPKSTADGTLESKRARSLMFSITEFELKDLAAPFVGRDLGTGKQGLANGSTRQRSRVHDTDTELRARLLHRMNASGRLRMSAPVAPSLLPRCSGGCRVRTGGSTDLSVRAGHAACGSDSEWDSVLATLDICILKMNRMILDHLFRLWSARISRSRGVSMESRSGKDYGKSEEGISDRKK
ncbi:hypothetical protein C8R45DRAFT_943733 [Mycena sanguinolenta]|nr:hypothetical protein C8R45DRAFT_943733 [Mycena sanguinolenta]